MTALGIALIKALAGLLVIIAGLVWFRRDATKDANNKTALAAAEKYAKTRKAIDDVEIPHDDPAALRDWLKARGSQ